MKNNSLSEVQVASLIEKSMKDPDFRNLLISDPNAAIRQEFGISLPEHVNLSVKEETPDQVYLVLPARLNDSYEEELSLEELDQVAGGGPTYGCVTGGYDCITKNPDYCK
jgi:hypothetical protein